jgi:Gas vesicle protein
MSTESRVLQPTGGVPAATGTQNLADILERVLDKGIVIAGDIQINLLEIELLTVKLRLLVASVDKAREMGIDWWEADPALSRSARQESALEDRLGRLEEAVGLPSPEAARDGAEGSEADGRGRGR